jgi:hypothetical protein
LGFELRSSHLIGRCSITWTHSTNSFCIGYFWERVSLYGQTGMNCDPPNCSSLHSWDDRHIPLSPAIGWDGVS